MKSKKHFTQLLEKLDGIPYAEHFFTTWRQLPEPNAEFFDVDNAAKFFFMLLGSFSKTGTTFSYSADKANHAVFYRNRVKNLIEHKDLVLSYLEQAQILNKDALTLMQNVDTHISNVLFFIDPPYPDASHEYYAKYSMSQYIDLLEALPKLRNKFILTTYANEHLDRLVKENKWKVNKKFVQHVRPNHTQQKEQQPKEETTVLNYG